MKMYYGNTPVNSLNINYFERDTNDCDMVASDLQAGKTAVARGQKITGTGKCFSFATYGDWTTNISDIIPMMINVVHVGSVDYPVKMTDTLNNTKFYDFSVAQQVAEITIDGVVYPITISVQNDELMIACEKTINLQLFMGKDEYI